MGRLRAAAGSGAHCRDKPCSMHFQQSNRGAGPFDWSTSKSDSGTVLLIEGRELSCRQGSHQYVQSRECCPPAELLRGRQDVKTACERLSKRNVANVGFNGCIGWDCGALRKEFCMPPSSGTRGVPPIESVCTHMLLQACLQEGNDWRYFFPGHKIHCCHGGLCCDLLSNRTQ